MKYCMLNENKRESLEGVVLSLMLIVFLVLGIGICSTFAQVLSVDPNYPAYASKNAGKIINVLPEVNLAAKAIPMRQSINSPFAELKPAFAPHGDKLYFSRVSHPDNT